MAVVRRRLLVSGRVQGVFFRDGARRETRSAGVAGEARNLPDGRVEILLEGEAGAVEDVVEWCRRGPPGAVVTDVAVADEPPEGLSGFSIR